MSQIYPGEHSTCKESFTPSEETLPPPFVEKPLSLSFQEKVRPQFEGRPNRTKIVRLAESLHERQHPKSGCYPAAGQPDHHHMVTHTLTTDEGYFPNGKKPIAGRFRAAHTRHGCAATVVISPQLKRRTRCQKRHPLPPLVEVKIQRTTDHQSVVPARLDPPNRAFQLFTYVYASFW